MLNKAQLRVIRLVILESRLGYPGEGWGNKTGSGVPPGLGVAGMGGGDFPREEGTGLRDRTEETSSSQDGAWVEVWRAVT